MADDIVIRYRAEVDEALKKIQAFADANTKVAKSTEATQKAIDAEGKSIDKLEKTVDGLIPSLDQVEKANNDLANSTTTASKALDAEGKSIEKLEKGIDELVKEIRQIGKSNQDIAKSTNLAAKALDAQGKSVDKLDKGIDNLANEIKEVGKANADLAKSTLNANKALDAGAKSVDKLDKELSQTSGTFDKVGGKVKSFAAGAGAALAAAFSVNAILNFTQRSVEAFAAFERGRTTFTNFVGDATLAAKIFDELQDFSIKSPFSREEVESGARALLQFGVANEEVVETIKLLGDVSAGTGKNLTELSIIFGQIKSTGRLMGQDLLQLINAGFNPLQIISEKTGKSVAVLKKEMEQGKISFEQVADAFKIATSEGGKFFNLTKQLGETTAGKLATLSDETDALAISIGERLAPAYLKAKKAGLQFLSVLTDIFLRSSDQTQIDAVQKRYKNQFDILTAQVEGAYDALVKQGLSADDARVKSIEQTEKRIKELLYGVPGVSFPRFAPGSDQEIRLRNELKFLEQINKSLENKNKLSQSGATIEAASSAEATKNADERIAGSAQEVQLIERLTAQYKDLLALQRLTPEQKQILDLSLSTGDIEQFKREVAKLTAENDIKLFADIILTVPEDRVVKEEGEKLGGSLADSFLKRFQEEIAVTGALLGELSQLYSAFTDQKLQEIEREREAQILAIDEQLKANQDALSKNRVSEQEAADNEKKLLAEKLKAEETAAKKERELKRKAALADKAAALAQIAISTAVNIVKAGNPALIALYAALGAAQAAIVVAQPIPYAKGTKKAKKGLARVGEEGEEIMYVPGGTKVLPNKQTNRYSDVLDAMFDNRFDQLYIKRKDIAPQLIKQKQIREVNNQKSFAENIAQSAMINPATGLTYFDMEALRKKGQNLTDDTIERLATAITKRSGYDPYRR